MTKIGRILFALLFLAPAVYGQKVKYKDIYALLSTKQYEQAERFLKNYIRQTTDNPNAFLYMGTIFQEKASKNDVLKETRVAVANMDSAILYYDQATKLIDEREVRRNKEYYQSYSRRDLRTGEFGIKLSDIQFDLEKRIEGLRERTGQVKMTRHFFSLADTTYRRTNALFLSLQDKFPSEKQLYLRADEGTVHDLSAMSLRFDSCMKAFENYITVASSAGKTGYNQKLSLADIRNFKTDGREVADLFTDEVKWWDYKKFADKSREVIQKKIFPMRKHLLAYDREINKLRDKLNTDSVSVRTDLMKVTDQQLFDQIGEFDPDPLPMVVLGLKAADLEYRSMVIEHKPLRDSADVHLQVLLLEQEMGLLAKLDSSAEKLLAGNLDEKMLDYGDFVANAYNNPAVLKSYIRSLREFGLREQKEKSERLHLCRRSLNYVLDGMDSIPLYSDGSRFYRPLVITPEKFTVGLSFRDTTKVQGYFYTITPSRKADVKAFFPVTASAFASSGSDAKALAYADPDGQIYYVLVYCDKPVAQKFPCTLAKIYRSDGLAWKIDYPLAFVPAELAISDAGELVIRNGASQALVDKNGKKL